MPFNPLVPSRNRHLRSDPFALLQNEIDVLFDDFGRGFFQTRSGDLVPRVDVSETENTLEVTAELPGLELKDVQIEFSDDVLTIKGEKRCRRNLCWNLMTRPRVALFYPIMRRGQRPDRMACRRGFASHRLFAS